MSVRQFVLVSSDVLITRRLRHHSDPDSDLNFVDWTNNQGVSALCVACSKNAEESAMVSGECSRYR